MREATIVNRLCDNGVCVSLAEARRLVRSGLVRQKGESLSVDDVPTTDPITIGHKRVIDPNRELDSSIID